MCALKDIIYTSRENEKKEMYQKDCVVLMQPVYKYNINMNEKYGTN